MSGTPRAWGWVHHLRDGGTTPWADWVGDGDPLRPGLPGAQQLELLRRLNRSGPVSPVLADRVLGASAVGRGQPDLELVGAASEAAFGPRPVDPADVSADELLRVVTALLAEDVAAAGVPRPRRRRRARPWRVRYQLVGDPELVNAVRVEMAARGRPPGGGDEIVVVLGTDLGRMLADAWTGRCFYSGVRSWDAWVRRQARHDRLPPRTDLAQIAEEWAHRVGPDRVHVVLDASELPALLGVRRRVKLPDAPDAAVPDLGRRVAAAIGLYAPTDQTTALLRHRLRPMLSDTGGPSLGVPEPQLAWVTGQAERMGEAIRHAGYAVHGRVEALLPTRRDAVTAPSAGATLDLALRVLRRGSPTTTGNEEET